MHVCMYTYTGYVYIYICIIYTYTLGYTIFSDVTQISPREGGMWKNRQATATEHYLPFI